MAAQRCTNVLPDRTRNSCKKNSTASGVATQECASYLSLYPRSVSTQLLLGAAVPPPSSTQPSSGPPQRSDDLLALHHAAHPLRGPRAHRPLLPPPRQVGVTRARATPPSPSPQP
eukprot:scaffold95110_cov60-Phaeocystis_antarctica.AAC.3